MPDSDPTTHTLDVPGARLYYEQRGAGPLLLMIGSPMDSTGFTGLASALARDYTVVTYDPRGIGGSSREDTTQDVTPEQQADDVRRLLSALGGEPADVFGSSGGGGGRAGAGHPLPGRGGGEGDAEVHGPRRPGGRARPGRRRTALGTLSAADGPDARHHR